MLALARGIVPLDRLTRSGTAWLSGRADRPTLSGRRLGLVGLGNIGLRIAKRASGFDMTVGYHTRHARADTPYRHYDDLSALARDSDYLVVACPGGPATRKPVNAAVLDVLGPPSTRRLKQTSPRASPEGRCFHQCRSEPEAVAAEYVAAGIFVFTGSPPRRANFRRARRGACTAAPNRDARRCGVIRPASPRAPPDRALPSASCWRLSALARN